MSMELAIDLTERKAMDTTLPKGLREFYKKELKYMKERYAMTKKPKVQPPKAFLWFLDSSHDRPHVRSSDCSENQ